MDSFAFSAHDRFTNRVADLARLEDWWSGTEANVLALYGRRRVGKSWLLRQFAHAKPAVLLVADRRALGPQLERFAQQLEPLMGFRPALDGIASLIQALYSIAGGEPALAVIDEFPYLLPSQEKERVETLTTIQRVMEERDASRLKLVLCGSYVGQMERLLKGPLRGRLTPMMVEPLSFGEASEFMAPGCGAVDRIERYAVAGGMSLYVDELARGGLRARVCSRVLDPRGPLFNDPREVLEEVLRMPGTYYSLLEELSTGRKSLGNLAGALGRRTTDLQGYLNTLREMRVVRRMAPISARENERNHLYSLEDGFMRFWFRFVFPFQEELKTGMPVSVLYDAEIAPCLADHVSPTFEALCRAWALRTGRATRVGSWWGNALNEHRRAGTRQTEEIDLVGLRRSVVTIVGECKWTSDRVGPDVLTDLETYKVPALRQAKVRMAKGGPNVVLISKGGFKASLLKLARYRDDVQLLDAGAVVGDLLRREGDLGAAPR